jgi:hypothetical protein
MASYNPVHNNCRRDAILVSLVNCFTSLLASLVVFAVLGYKVRIMNDYTEIRVRYGARKCPAAPLPGNFRQHIFAGNFLTLCRNFVILYTGMPYNLLIVYKSVLQVKIVHRNRPFPF